MLGVKCFICDNAMKHSKIVPTIFWSGCLISKLETHVTCEYKINLKAIMPVQKIKTKQLNNIVLFFYLFEASKCQLCRLSMEGQKLIFNFRFWVN